MQRFYLSVVLTFVILMNGVNVYPIPAKITPFIIKQSDGTELTVRLRGDENFHYYTTLDGYLLLPDSQGVLCYANIQSGEVLPSIFKAKEINERTTEEINFLQVIDKGIQFQAFKARQQTKSMRYQSPRRKALTNYPTTGEQKALIVLVQFTDRKFDIDNPLQAFDDMINLPGYSEHNGTGSARDFFIENSAGRYLPDFDVFGPVTLSNKMSYYGGNDRNGDDLHPEEMVIEACKQLDKSINFADYDRDKDGFVDNIYVFYAGYGEASGGPDNSVWPHAWGVYSGAGQRLVLDGVQIDSYACSNELGGGSGSKMNGIGTFCHEFSHVLGLPDLYATDYAESFTPDSWSLMDYGPYNNDGRTPPYMSSFERYSLGWLEPAVITVADTTFLLPDISKNKAYMIKTEKTNEYFMLENRQQDSWDKYIPGHGMLVWHIDYNENVWANNVVNNTPKHQYVDIEEADGTQTRASLNGDTFPGTENITSLTDDTAPSLKSWSGSRRNLSIFDITEKDGLVTFKVIDPTVKPAAPVAKEATLVGSTSFQANWEETFGVMGYELDVYKKDNDKNEYLPDYQDMEVVNAPSLLITGLEPDTDYYYVVRSKTSLQKSMNSEEVHIRTTKPAIDYFAPVAKEATSIAFNSFTANWEELEGAEDYLIYVYRKTIGEDATIQNDFTGGFSAMPEGWETSCTSVYSSSGFYGQSLPSLKFDSDGLLLESPMLEGNITSLSFWCRGASASESNVLLISGYDGNSWSEIHSISPIDNSARTYTLSAEEYFSKSYHAIRFTYKKIAGGNLALDDIKIKSGGTESQMVPGFDGKMTGNVTSMLVDGLESETEYYYLIKGTSGALSSKLSNEISVTTAKQTATGGCLKLIPDDLQVSYSGNLIMIENHTSSQLEARIYTPLGQCLGSRPVHVGNSTLSLEPGQVYIIKVGTYTFKVVL